MRRRFGELLTLLEDGGGIEISAKDFDLGHILTLVEEAVNGGGTLSITETDVLTLGELETIREEGKRHVVFR